MTELMTEEISVPMHHYPSLRTSHETEESLGITDRSHQYDRWYQAFFLEEQTLSSVRGFEPDALWVPLRAERIIDLGTSAPIKSVDEPKELFEPEVDLAHMAKDLRTWLDLPVDDIARLCGVKRRQFYNILEDRLNTSTLREKHVRLVHGILRDLREKLGSDKKLRAAVLMPITSDYKSFFDVCAEKDPDRIREVGTELADRIDTGRVAGMLPRAAPMFKGRSKASSALEAIRDES